MTDLRRTPSLQHAVALIRETVPETILELQKLDAAQINMSLNPSRRLFKAMMEGAPLDWAIRQIELDKKLQNIKPNIALVETFSHYSKGKNVPWFRICEPHFYPIGAGIIIPVQPNGFWAESGKFRVLWPQCWKNRTLSPQQRAIFNTILHDTFFVGDFKNADLEWVDMREQFPRAGRSIEVLSADALGRVSREELTSSLSILVEAFQQHHAEKMRRRAEERRTRPPKKGGTPLFGDDLPGQPKS
jgi:hypothetical protein